jgi:hypothetical protein
MLPIKSTLFGWLQYYSQIFDLPMTNTLASLYGVSVSNKRKFKPLTPKMFYNIFFFISHIPDKKARVFFTWQALST